MSLELLPTKQVLLGNSCLSTLQSLASLHHVSYLSRVQECHRVRVQWDPFCVTLAIQRLDSI